MDRLYVDVIDRKAVVCLPTGVDSNPYQRDYLLAVRIYKHIMKMRRARNFRRSRHVVGHSTIRVGRKVVIIGCQQLTFSEIDQFARAQGWAK